MSAGLYDDLVAPSAPAVMPGSLADARKGTPAEPNPYADLAPPTFQAGASSGKPGATAADRVQAGEAGLLRGGAYLAGLVPDTIANAVNLGKAAAGFGYHELTGNPIPSALEVNGDVSPVGHAITEQLDKSPVTTTQVARPDDAASRYLSTAASVVPGVLSGGEATIPALTRGLATAVPPALAGQYVAEKKPFQSDAANNAAAVLTQALGSATMPKLRGAPVASKANDAVQAGQEAGLVFPPGTTNPTPGNRLLSSVAGKTSIDQHASVENQPTGNDIGRAAMGVPASGGAPISDVEIAQAKSNFAPGYQAMRNAGQIVVPMNWTQRLSAALNKQSGASRLDPSLTDSQLNTTVANLSRLKNFDASDAMDTIDALRDRSSAAFREGNAQAGRAYRDTSKVIEDAIDSDLSRSPQTADVVQNFRNSRQGFAAISTVEENRNPTTGNLQAQKLAAALKGGDYLGPAGAPLRTLAESAGQAPKAFAEPTSTPGSSHLGFWGSLLGMAEIGQHLPLEHGSLELAAVPAIYQGARLGARKYALGPGQGGAVQYQPGQVDPRLLLGGLTSAPGNLSTTP